MQLIFPHFGLLSVVSTIGAKPLDVSLANSILEVVSTTILRRYSCLYIPQSHLNVETILGLSQRSETAWPLGQVMTVQASGDRIMKPRFIY